MLRSVSGLAAIFCLGSAAAQTPSPTPQFVSLRLVAANAAVKESGGGTLTVTDDMTGNMAGVTMTLKSKDGPAYDERVRFTLTAPPDPVEAVIDSIRVNFLNNAFPLTASLSYAGPAGDHAEAFRADTGECIRNTGTDGSGPYACTIKFGLLDTKDGRPVMRFRFQILTALNTVNVDLFYSLGGGGVTKDSITPYAVLPEPGAGISCGGDHPDFRRGRL